MTMSREERKEKYREAARERARRYYHANRENLAEKRALNREAKTEYNREYHKSNKERIAERKREWRLSRNYGINYAQKEEMLRQQNGVCASCGEPNPGSRDKGWSVDHCHTTGRIRGILCLGCNTSIGLLQESPDRFRKAAAYLERHGKNATW